MTIYSVDGTGCGQGDVKYLPRSFRVVLSAPIYLDGLPLSEGDGQALLSRMDKNNNPKRIIYVRYNLRTIYIEPLRKIEDKRGDRKTLYIQTSDTSSKTVRFDAHLDSIGFYEDQERTKLIYQFTP
jgi:hypothetical protein